MRPPRAVKRLPTPTSNKKVSSHKQRARVSIVRFIEILVSFSRLMFGAADVRYVDI